MNIYSSLKKISCCHRYRECSDAKKCLIEDNELSSVCVYKKNLDNGKIFYGKNALNFSLEKYETIKNTYFNLDEKTSYEFNCILMYFFHYNSGLTHELWYYSNELETLSQLGLIEIIADNNILYKLTINHLNFLEKEISSDNKNNFNTYFEKLKKETPEITNYKNKKHLLCEYLIKQNDKIIEDFINQFRYVRLSNENFIYLYELYYDFLKNEHEEYKRDMPKNKEKMFLKEFTRK